MKHYYKDEGIFEDTKSVHLRQFPAVPKDWNNAELENKWSIIREFREGILYTLEQMRINKDLKSSLEGITKDFPPISLLSFTLLSFALTSPIAPLLPHLLFAPVFPLSLNFNRSSK